MAELARLLLATGSDLWIIPVLGHDEDSAKTFGYIHDVNTLLAASSS